MQPDERGPCHQARGGKQRDDRDHPATRPPRTFPTNTSSRLHERVRIVLPGPVAILAGEQVTGERSGDDRESHVPAKPSVTSETRKARGVDPGAEQRVGGVPLCAFSRPANANGPSTASNASSRVGSAAHAASAAPSRRRRRHSRTSAAPRSVRRPAGKRSSCAREHPFAELVRFELLEPARHPRSARRTSSPGG